jgi:DNA-binding response OmpR family regulator
MLKYLRDNSAQLLSICPICVVSELDDYEVMKEVMDVGVSEYLVKPVNINMLKLKSEYLLSGKSLGKILDVQHQSFSLDGKKIPDLTVKQQQILSLFMNSPERVVNRKELLAKIWNDTSVNPKTVDVHLYNLRRKISEHGFLIRSEGGGNWSLMSQKIRV